MDQDRQLTFSEIDELLERPSASGVLSIHLDPLRENRHQSRLWTTTLKTGLKELAGRHPEDRALARLIERAADELMLSSPEDRHRSLAYYASAVPEWTWRRTFLLPTETRFVWSDIPFVRPLVRLIDHWQDTGVVVYSQEAARLFELGQGSGAELADARLEIHSDEWRDYRGPARMSGGPGQTGHSQMDQFEQRIQNAVRRFLREVGKSAGQQAETRNWSRFVLFGPAELRDPLLEGLGPNHRRKVLAETDTNLVGSTESEVIEAAMTEVERVTEQGQLEEVQNLLEAAHAKGNGVVGVQQVLDLLAQRRVRRLFFASEVHLEGFRRPDGSYGVGEASAVKDARPERHLIERMIEQAYESGATVCAATGEAARILKDAGGVAAMLFY